MRDFIGRVLAIAAAQVITYQALFYLGFDDKSNILIYLIVMVGILTNEAMKAISGKGGDE